VGIGVLGTAVVDGAADLPSRERRVLAALVLDAPQLVSRDRLAELVWGDDRPASWNKVLQNAVSRLRRALGFDAIRSGPGGYRLDAAADIDARRFEQLIDLAEGEVASDPIAAQRHLDDARSLWRGPPFVDLENGTHALGAIRRLESRRRLLDELQVEVDLATGRLDDAIALSTALLEVEPFDERRAGLLATSLYRAGRSVDALNVLRAVRRSLRTELGLDPGPGLVALELAVLRHDASLVAEPKRAPRADAPTAPRARRAGNVPMPLSRLFGRGHERNRIGALLGPERLVVLTGAGGVGKSRLAIAIAHQSTFAGGAWWVDLAQIEDPADVASLVCDAFGFLPRDGLSPRRSVVEGITNRDVLLVLDNCDHVLDEVGRFAVDTLDQCPGMCILATSREPLGVDGEHVVPLAPLPVETDSVDLFIDRADHADVSLGVDERPDVLAVCRRLDGIPLAIELAAAHMRTLPLRELARRLDEHLDVLATRRHGRPDRHRTMRAAVDWTYQSIGEDERVAFCRLAVFSGYFDLTAAEQVIAGPPLGTDTLELIGRLVDLSLVTVDTGKRASFRLLEPLRQFAAEQLTRRGEAADLARRHAGYYADLCAQLADILEGPDEIDAVGRLDSARANVRTAFATAAASNDVDLALRIVAALARYTNTQIWAEPWAWCEAALALPGADAHPLRARALVHLSRGAWQLGDHSRALALADEAVALADGDTTMWRDAQTARSVALTFLGRLEEAVTAASAGAEPSTSDTRASSLGRIATMLLIRNVAGRPEPERAADLLERSRASSPSMHALALHTASVVAATRDTAREIVLNERALELARASGATLVEGFALSVLASLESQVHPAAGAARHVDVMERYLGVGNGTHLRGFGRTIIVPLVECRAHEAAAVVDGATRTASEAIWRHAPVAGAVKRARDELGPRYDEAIDRGEQMTDDDLVRYLRDVVAALDR
jgi:predicted ATPase/DNA-binding SARP family transcriptional activator